MNSPAPSPANSVSCSALETLTLEGNAISGPIPPELGGLTDLRWLHLGRNELIGHVPQTLLELEGLTSLTLEGNPGLCIPGTGAFSRWLRGIQTASWGAYCNGGGTGGARTLP